jgi:DNA polymerase-4
MRRKEFYATCFTFSLRTTCHKNFCAQARTPPSQDNFSFLCALDEMWQALSPECRHFSIKKVSLSLSGLCKRDNITPDLFDMGSPAHRALQKHELSRAIDELNKKYGPQTVQIGPSPLENGGYVGTKIAFSRIPESSEFYE